MHIRALCVCFNFYQLEIIKVICMSESSYSALKYGISEGYLQFYQIKHKQLS